MKTFVPFSKIVYSAVVLTVSLLTTGVFAQSGQGGVSGSGKDLLTNGLSFSNPKLETSGNTDLKVGAKYLFEDVFAGVDARLTIDSLVGGAKVIKVDDNSNGLGYTAALQPEIQSGNIIGRSYAVFTITFYEANTTVPKTLQTVDATALDIDGNLNLKEFAEMRMGNGGTASYMGNTSDLSLFNLLTGKYRADNVLGIERTGIDTSAMSNMFTANNNNISSFTVKYGTIATLATSTTRQFSLYMKGFAYPNQVTLPVELAAFSAMLNTDNKVDLRWITASEINVSHFVIEKSFDGKEFSDAGVVFAAGNSNEKINYSFTDTKINASQTGMIYYRLRSVDIDGRKQYSSIRMVRFSKQNDQAIAIATYPNPVTSELRVTVPSNWQGKKVSYQILDNNGRLLIRTESGNSSQTEAINVASLNSGMYMVRVICNGETAIQKVVKQ